MIIRSFKLFESHSDIKDICYNHRIFNYTINEDRSIDINDDVDLGKYRLERLPLKFRNVTGSFSIGENSLTSLDGCPKYVGRGFYCSYNHLTSLKGGPESVGGEFYCAANKLTSLEGCPERIGGVLYCAENHLTSLRGFPEMVEDFDCHQNPVYEVYSIRPRKEFAELLVEYDVIRDGNNVVETRLRQALEDSGCNNIPEEFKFKNYQLI